MATPGFKNEGDYLQIKVKKHSPNDTSKVKTYIFEMIAGNGAKNKVDSAK